ncbi:hypothetical protein [Brachybacterium muris]|uniref:Restriction endonuclease type II-like domain-containing protein n=1 Tax=Brachybacterium muris UCD-AY4 TaxID=1249481 RepID=A0A022L0Q3_9MICO|nr:hypothetical protein [Brachybacterium muris]EYT51027.1 hypothetical protein D641_0100730 [Brachybacterium muris UCD-AY4]
MWRFLRGKKNPEASAPADARRDDAQKADRGTSRAPATSGDAAPVATGAGRDDDTGRDGSAAQPPAHLAERRRAAGEPPLHPGIDVVVAQRLGGADAGTAPEQDEDDLPRPVREHRPLSREDVVADALDRWHRQITGGETAPSFLTQMRAGATYLDLTHSHPSGLAQLLAGRGPTRLSSLVREVGALADARAHARTLREIAERHAEEVGLTTCHLGIGEATWHPEDGSEPVHAPVLVRPITLRLRGNAREDVDLDLDATADLNPVLLRALREAGVAVDARALLATTDKHHGFDPNPVLDAFRALGQPLPGFRITHALVVGNIMDAAGSVGDDLDSDLADWSASPVVAALAGHEPARTEVRAGILHESENPPDIEALAPEDELVAAVDPDHREALAKVLAGKHLAIAAPPGSDTLDLVVDLAEELNARGRSVLVVSQRRRNLSQLTNTAEERGIEELVFDLSPDPSLQRNASAALLRSLRRAGTFGLGTEDSAAEPAELTRTREILTGHVEAMHRIQQPWQASAHDAISALAALTRQRPAPRTTVRLRSDVAAQMIGEDRERYAEALREAATVGVLTSGPETTAWYGAPISSDTQAERAEALVDELRTVMLPQLRKAAASTGNGIGLRHATSLEELLGRIALLDRVRGVLATFQPAVFRAELAELVAATGDKTWRADHGVTMGWGVRRRLRKEGEALQRPASLTTDLHRDLLDARRVRDSWRQIAVDDTKLPTVPEDLEQVRATAQKAQRILDELSVLLDGTVSADGTETSRDLTRTPFDDLERRLDALHRDRGDLDTLPRRTELLRRLEFDGLGELVEDLRTRRVPAAHVTRELDLAWWRSVLEFIAGAEPTISQYDGTSLSQVAERFRRLDAEHLANSAARVHAAADEVRVATMKSYPDTSRAAIAELARASTVSIRDLSAKYEDILFRSRPTWLASPYLVPQVIPRGRHFDVVIVADGGRLPTAAALPSIVRASQTVVVGDPLEYGGEDQPSLLDDMLRIAEVVELGRDGRPAAEGLRAFAHRRALMREVLAVPSPVAPEPDRLVLVENGRGPVTEGMEYVESTEGELRRVTDLVIEHARTRPERSLAVLTFTSEHARRLMERIMQTVAVIPALRGFFDPGAPEFFTVLPAAHASSIVRDDVIVSVGFGRTPHGRLLHRFGPLSEAGGRKALATVITRARGRTTVVSSIDVQDLDPSRLRSEGARDLRAMLWVLRGGADVEVVPQVAALTGLEQTAVPAVEETAAPTADTAQVQTEARSDATDTTEPVSAFAADGDAEMSDEDFDAALEAALARKAAGEQAPQGGGQDDAADDADDPDDADDQDGAIRSGPSDEQQPVEQASADTGELETDALVRDLADRLWRLGLVVESDFGLTSDRIELALGHPELPGRLLLAVDTDGSRYVGTRSQRERDRLRAERLERAGWATERVWSWALFIDPDGEAERIRRAVERALRLMQTEEQTDSLTGVGTVRHRLPRPQIPAGHPLSFYSSEDFDAVVEYICSDGRARLEEHLATEVRSFLGFEQRSVLLDVSVSSAIRRYQERQ